MSNIKKAGVLVVAAVAVTLLAFTASTAGAQGDDLNCGDPGTSHNMPVDPNDDPHNLDADGDGVGCEDASAFEGMAEPEAPAAPEPPADEAAEAPADDTAEPAEPVVDEPSYTG